MLLDDQIDRKTPSENYQNSPAGHVPECVRSLPIKKRISAKCWVLKSPGSKFYHRCFAKASDWHLNGLAECVTFVTLSLKISLCNSNFSRHCHLHISFTYKIWNSCLWYLSGPCLQISDQFTFSWNVDYSMEKLHNNRKGFHGALKTGIESDQITIPSRTCKQTGWNGRK